MPGHTKIFWRICPHLILYSVYICGWNTFECWAHCEELQNVDQRLCATSLIKQMVRYTPKDFSTRTIGKETVWQTFSLSCKQSLKGRHSRLVWAPQPSGTHPLLSLTSATTLCFRQWWYGSCNISISGWKKVGRKCTPSPFTVSFHSCIGYSIFLSLNQKRKKKLDSRFTGEFYQCSREQRKML